MRTPHLVGLENDCYRNLENWLTPLSTSRLACLEKLNKIESQASETSVLKLPTGAFSNERLVQRSFSVVGSECPQVNEVSVLTNLEL